MATYTLIPLLSPIVRFSRSELSICPRKAMETSSDESTHRTSASVERHPFTNRSACSKDTFTFSVVGATFAILIGAMILSQRFPVRGDTPRTRMRCRSHRLRLPVAAPRYPFEPRAQAGYFSRAARCVRQSPTADSTGSAVAFRPLISSTCTQ